MLSRLLNPIREGGHSLNMWGYHPSINLPKIDFDDYSKYSKEMMDYCVRDVQVNKLVLDQLRREARGFSKESIELEHAVGDIIKQQEVNGFEFNKPKSEKLLAELYKRMAEVENEVHETFKPKTVREEIVPKYTQTGALSKLGLNLETRKGVHLSIEEKDMFAKGDKKIIRTHEEPFNLGSRKQIENTYKTLVGNLISLHLLVSLLWMRRCLVVSKIFQRHSSSLSSYYYRNELHR